MSTLVRARDLEEGNEILLRRATGQTGIVEAVETRWAGIGREERTTVTMCDGTTYTVNSEHEVTAYL